MPRARKTVAAEAHPPSKRTMFDLSQSKIEIFLPGDTSLLIIQAIRDEIALTGFLPVMLPLRKTTVACSNCNITSSENHNLPGCI
jgi:hypothetical protein